MPPNTDTIRPPKSQQINQPTAKVGEHGFIADGGLLQSGDLDGYDGISAADHYTDPSVYDTVMEAVIRYKDPADFNMHNQAAKVLANNLPTLCALNEMTKADPDRPDYLDRALHGFIFSTSHSAPGLARLAAEAIVDPDLQAAAQRLAIAPTLGQLAEAGFASKST